MKNTIDKISEQIAAFQTDAALQIDKGNKAAGARARKTSLKLTELLKEFRKISVVAKAVILAITALFVSCNRSGDYEPGYGSLQVTALSDPTVIDIDSQSANAANTTRAANLDTKTYHLTLRSATATAYDGTMPASGTLAGIPAGAYTATLRSSAQEFAAPTFDAPFYSATVAGVVVTPGGTTPVKFECRQTNAGVRFVYDASLATAGMGAVVPVVAQGESNLVFADADRTATGYFRAGSATLTLTLDGKPLTVGGAGSVPLTLAARQVWTVTLRANATGGNTGITAEVDAGTDGKDETVTLDPPETPIDPASIVLEQSFAACTGPALPVAGAVFNAGAVYAMFVFDDDIAAAGLTGWGLTSVYSAAGGVRVGKSAVDIYGSAGGSITTPALTALGSDPTTVTVSFRAASFEPAAGAITVSVAGGGTVSSPAGGVIALPAGTANGSVVAESATMKRYTVVITGATSATRITFSTGSTTTVNRFLLSGIVISK